MSIPVGTHLGSYEITALLGKGGMGEVYRARDSKLKRDVAIKILPDEFNRDPDRVSRFQREAEVLASFNHPNIAAIYDMQEANGMRFLVLELVEGETLAERIGRGPLPIDDVLSIAMDIGEALATAHEQGIVHRDLKPGNVKISPGGKVKVLDFGLATAPYTKPGVAPLLDSTKEFLTKTGVIMGTLAYMSPEQATGRPVDERSDIFCFGAVLYEMLGGRRPFDGQSELALLHAVVYEQAPSLEKLRAGLPIGLQIVVEKALEKDPADRYRSMEALLGDLRDPGLAKASRRAKTTPPNNLPIQPTSFIGRAKETAEVRELLAGTRLLTLTGAGGTGKSRLAMQAADETLQEFPEGIWFIELAPLADPVLVLQTAAIILGVRETEGQLTMTTLTDHLQDRRLLLILDNCEHLIQACAQFTSAILHTCQHVRVLATSREALGIAGEISWPVASMQTPPPSDSASASQIVGFEAVQLFSERARAVKPDFHVTDQNASIVAQICHRLDGIPLALELAAARVKMFSVEQIAARLDDRFRLLTGGSRTALPRQQTLRSLIDWSHGLLSDSERVLLRRLSVFAGGWTYEAAEAACSGGGIHDSAVLDLLSHLVDKSLVIVVDHQNQARYRMLETIRQYAREKLLESREGELVRRQHLNFFMNLAEAGEPEFYGNRQSLWLSRLELDIDNLRVALDWSQGTRAIEEGSRLLSASHRFWWLRGQSREALQRLKEFLRQPELTPRTIFRARALFAAGFFESWVHSNFAEAQPLLSESLEIAQEVGNKKCAGQAQLQLGVAAQNQGDYETARLLFEKSKLLAQAANDTFSLGLALLFEGDQAFLLGEFEQATTLYDRVAQEEKRQNSALVPYSLRRLGQCRLLQGHAEEAVAFIMKSLTENWALRDKQGAAACLAALAAVAIALGRAVEAATLFGAVDAALRSIRAQLLYVDQTAYNLNFAAVRVQLDSAAFNTAWIDGQTLTIEQAIELAMKQFAV